MGLAKSIMPRPPPRQNKVRKKRLSFLCFIKELTDETSLSYTPRIIAMLPPLQPGTSMVPPTHIPFNITLILLSFFSCIHSSIRFYCLIPVYSSLSFSNFRIFSFLPITTRISSSLKTYSGSTSISVLPLCCRAIIFKPAFLRKSISSTLLPT